MMAIPDFETHMLPPTHPARPLMQAVPEFQDYRFQVPLPEKILIILHPSHGTASLSVVTFLPFGVELLCGFQALSHPVFPCLGGWRDLTLSSLNPPEA